MLPPGSKLYTGVSLHIGLNRVDPQAYDGWDGRLSGCVNDATAMQAIAQTLGYNQSLLLLNEQATRKRISEEISRASEAISASDVFLLTYSGHGGQIPDADGDEADHYDETWCLFDGELLDDSLYELFCQFQERVRIIVVSDSCHSGTVVREYKPFQAQNRGLPSSLIQPAYQAQKDYYDQVRRLGREKYNLKASICLLSGCQDNQTSMDGRHYGLFTEKLLEVWNSGAFRGDYWQFNREILKQMPANQSPNLLFVGLKNIYFEWARPFHIR